MLVTAAMDISKTRADRGLHGHADASQLPNPWEDAAPLTGEPSGTALRRIVATWVAPICTGIAPSSWRIVGPEGIH